MKANLQLREELAWRAFTHGYSMLLESDDMKAARQSAKEGHWSHPALLAMHREATQLPSIGSQWENWLCCVLDRDSTGEVIAQQIELLIA